MATLAIALPLVPGKTADYLRFVDEVKARRAEYGEFHTRMGLTKENWYLQHTPQGDLLIVYLEGDIMRAFQALAESQHPFDRWLKEKWLEYEGIDFSMPLPAPPPEVIFES